MSKYPLTEEECLRIGGHCYEQSNIVIDTFPETYHRICKHCGHTQHGWHQPNIKWEDSEKHE